MKKIFSIILLLVVLITVTACTVFEHEHELTHQEPIPATCEKDGAIGYYYCKGCGQFYDEDLNPMTIKSLNDFIVKALGHDYRFDSFVWSADNQSAEAKFVCSHDSSHVRL